MPVEDYLPEWNDLWERCDDNPMLFFHLALKDGRIDQELYDHEMSMLLVYEKMKPLPPEYEELLHEQAKAAVWNEPAGWFSTAWREFLKAFWGWIKDNIGEAFVIVKDIVTAAFDAYWPPVKDAIEAVGLKVFDFTMKGILDAGEITPEKAPAMAARAYTMALGAGITAHAMSVGFEMTHILKSLGFHQMTAIIAQLGAFGPLTGATLGQVYYSALRQPMSYAVNKVTRSKLPDDKLAIEFRSKREISYPEFEDLMGYHGYTDRWIRRIESWQWKDPRMLEIMRMAEDPIIVTPPPANLEDELRTMGITGERRKDWWLWRKFMRAGYEDCDIPNMIMAIHRKGIHNALTYFKTALRRNYRWGFATENDLREGMRDMGLTEEYIGWTKRAGALDREYFLKQDLIRQYELAYRNDVMSGRDFEVALTLLGLPPKTVTTMAVTEKIRKHPRVTHDVDPESERAMAKIQTKYTALYIEQYRKNIIDEAELLESLMAIGVLPELAEVTVDLEATKRLPKPPVESIT